MQILLTLGKAATKEAFNEQKEKILNAVSKIEAIIKTSVIAGYYLKLHNEIEKFKIKMEVLHLRFELGKLNTEKEFEAAKSEFLKRVNNIRSVFNEKEASLGKNWNYFSNEIGEAYIHLKKAFEKM